MEDFTLFKNYEELLEKDKDKIYKLRIKSFTKIIFDDLIKLMHNMPNLKIVNINTFPLSSKNYKDDVIDPSEFIYKLKNFNLIYVSIKIYKISKDIIPIIANFIKDNTLQRLSLKNNHYDSIEFEPILDSIISNNNINYLNLSNNQIEISTVLLILEKSKSIKYLKINDIDINDQKEYLKMIDLLKNNTIIKKIDFTTPKRVHSYYHIESYLLKSLTNMLKSNFNLTDIYFPTKISPEDMIEFAKLDCLLKLNQEWDKDIVNALYPLLCEKMRLFLGLTNDITIFDQKTLEKDTTKYTTKYDTIFLYWILKRNNLSKDIIRKILGGYWLLLPNKNNLFTYYKWKIKF